MATMVKERPIIFSSPMLRAILAGKKTQTRRIMRLQPWEYEDGVLFWGRNEYKAIEYDYRYGHCGAPHPDWLKECIFGKVGDRLWVRETWAPLSEFDPRPETGAIYRADGERHKGFLWRSPIHMPKLASRITLEITRVRTNRLNDITEADAIAEGLEVKIGDGTGRGHGFKWNGCGYWDLFSTCDYGKTYHAPMSDGLCCCIVGQKEKLTPARCAFRHLFDKINGKGSWSANPWVWAINFKMFK